MKPTPEQITKLPKWAQEAWAERDQELRDQLALRWPTYPKPSSRNMSDEIDALPAGSNRLITGWATHTHALDFRVSEGCSSGVYHSTDCTTKTNSQTAGVFYNTKLEALQWARWKMTQACARALSRIDKAIEECQ